MNSRTPFFLFGTLCDPELLEIVAGEPLEARAAVLRDHRACWVAGESFPMLTPVSGDAAHGILVELTATVRARLDFYEVGFGYGVETREALVGDTPVQASVYIPEGDAFVPGQPWSLAAWQEAHGALTREAAREYVRLIETHDPYDAARAFPMVRSRAASRLRAKAAPSPDAFGGAPGVAISEGVRQPYTDYFAVREDVIRVPRFGGGMAPAVKRATFMGGDAVTVLPYDPKTDSVLVVRQFRHGAYVRGDANPWCLEPPAGRIDVGETAEDAARRELQEETGLEAEALHLVSVYYPTPGAYSEHLTSYVAICDLAGRDGQVMGVANESEDIMSHVVSLDALAEMVVSGAANTGPLVLSAQWLLLNRASLS